MQCWHVGTCSVGEAIHAVQWLDRLPTMMRSDEASVCAHGVCAPVLDDTDLYCIQRHGGMP